MSTLTHTSATHADVLRDLAQRAQHAPFGGWWWLRVPIVAPVAWVLLHAHTRRRCQDWARQYVSTALVYRGFMAEIAQGKPEELCTPQADKIIDDLVQVERKFLASREQLLGMRSLMGTALQADMATVIEANADAFEAAQALRWEMMEMQADADIAAGRVHALGSTEETIAFLRAA